MPKRRVQKRFDTKDVQGDSSYVILSSLRVAERRQYVKDSKEEGFEPLEWSITLLTRHLVEWNWVDEDGKALPIPRDDPAVVDSLTDPEAELLAGFLMNPTAKN